MVHWSASLAYLVSSRAARDAVFKKQINKKERGRENEGGREREGEKGRKRRS